VQKQSGAVFCTSIIDPECGFLNFRKFGRMQKIAEALFLHSGNTPEIIFGLLNMCKKSLRSVFALRMDEIFRSADFYEKL